MGIVHNLVPKQMRRIFEAVQANDIKTAAEINKSLLHLYTMMEGEPYPGPVKAGLEILGLKVGNPRLPIVPASDEMRAKLTAAFKALGLI